MRELLKEARDALENLDCAKYLLDRIDSALSAPDESALEKVRRIREGGIPGHEVSPYYFTLTDSEAAALIQPSVPREMLKKIAETYHAAECCAEEGDHGQYDSYFSFLDKDYDSIAAEYGVKVR